MSTAEKNDCKISCFIVVLLLVSNGLFLSSLGIAMSLIAPVANAKKMSSFANVLQLLWSCMRKWEVWLFNLVVERCLPTRRMGTESRLFSLGRHDLRHGTIVLAKRWAICCCSHHVANDIYHRWDHLAKWRAINLLTLAWKNMFEAI